MNRRELIKSALGLGAAVGAANYVGLAAEEPLPCFTTAPEDTLCMALSIVFTREEVEHFKDHPALVRVKLANARNSLLRHTVDEFNKRGWAAPMTAEDVLASKGMR